MILEIKNPKAPGAKFTPFTLAIFMKAYDLSYCCPTNLKKREFHVKTPIEICFSYKKF